MCTALQLGDDIEQHWLMRKYDVIDKPKYVKYQYAARGGLSHGHR